MRVQLIWCLCVVAVLGLTMAGCAPANRDDLIQEVLTADPAFSEVLDRHQALINRIETFEQELALKRTTVEEMIAAMRDDVKVAKEKVKAKRVEITEQIQPDRARLELAVSLAGEKLRAAQVQRASLGRSVAQLRKSLKRDETALGSGERASRQTQMGEMERDASRLDQEMVTLKEHIHLLKIKLLLIRL